MLVHLLIEVAGGFFVVWFVACLFGFVFCFAWIGLILVMIVTTDTIGCNLRWLCLVGLVVTYFGLLFGSKLCCTCGVLVVDCLGLLVCFRCYC